MLTESIINQIKLQSLVGLPMIYEAICEEYRLRLCEMWEMPLEDAWWYGDEIGGGLFIADWWCPLEMQELRYIVEHNIPQESWIEYCDFVESEINNGQERPRINFHSWFELGARPKDLK